MRAYLAMVMLVCVGCGGEPLPSETTSPLGAVESPGDDLTGTWAVAGDGVWSGMAFDGAGNYATTVIRTGQARVDLGRYVARDGALTLTVTDDSCPIAAAVAAGTYSVKGDALDMLMPSAVFTLARSAEAPPLGDLTVGCFGDEGFTPRPVSKVGL